MLRSASLLAGLILTGLAISCGRATSMTPVTPKTVDLAALIDASHPNGNEQGVLLNFWATW